MRVLYVAGPSPATVFAFAPLATALRHAGHEVFMATTEEMMPVVEGAGLPGIPVTARSLLSFLTTDREGRPVAAPTGLREEWRHAGGWFGRLAAASLGPLLDLSRDWRPDLVVGGTRSYAAALLAAHLGVPHVRHAWDMVDDTEVDPHADAELRPELHAMGLERIPDPALFLDICPPALRRAGTAPAAPVRGVRWVPGNRQRKLQPWMYTRGDRPRICVTSGSRVTLTGSHDFLRDLVNSVSTPDVEVVVAAPEDAALPLRAALPGIRIGWIPMDVVAPTCDLIVHHGGGATGMTALNAGTPQLTLPQWAIFNESVQRVSAYGASLTLLPGEQTPDAVARAREELLGDPGYRVRARALSAEIAQLPSLARTVEILEDL